MDARKAHLDPSCEEDVFIELLEKCGYVKGTCGKLEYGLYGFLPAAAAWEKHYSELLELVSFARGEECGVVFHQADRDVGLAVHGDDFTCSGLDEDLDWVRALISSWFEIKVRARLRSSLRTR